MQMDYSVSIYNYITDIHSTLYTIEIWLRLGFEPVSETLKICHVWGSPAYFLEAKFYNPGVKITKWYPRSLIRVNTVSIQMH